VLTALVISEPIIVLRVDPWLLKLRKSLKASRSLTKIQFNRLGLTNKNAEELLFVLKANQSIINVDLRYNRIDTLPEGYAFLTHLRRLYLQHNPILHFPPKYILRSQDRLFQYFADFRAGSSKLTRMQLLFLGDGGAGKTFLKSGLKVLLQKSPVRKGSISTEEKKQSSSLMQRSIARVGRIYSFTLFGVIVHMVSLSHLHQI